MFALITGQVSVFGGVHPPENQDALEIVVPEKEEVVIDEPGLGLRTHNIKVNETILYLPEYAESGSQHPPRSCSRAVVCPL